MAYRIKRANGEYFEWGYAAQKQETFTPEPAGAAYGDETSMRVIANLLRENGHQVEVELPPCEDLLLITLERTTGVRFI